MQNYGVRVPASLDTSRIVTDSSKRTIMVQKDGLRISFKAKRKGAHRPKKKRNS